MLHIIQNRASASAKSYYAHSDYFSESQELTGRRSGRAAAMVGLSGEVDKLSLDRLCDNLDPRSGGASLDHFWAGRIQEEEFDAPAARAFVVSGVPTAILISTDGRILWRGHPLEAFSGKSLQSLVENALP